jgi:hypothetical protein
VIGPKQLSNCTSGYAMMLTVFWGAANCTWMIPARSSNELSTTGAGMTLTTFGGEKAVGYWACARA